MARVPGAVLAILGIGYAWRGASVLLSLTDVTNAWIVASRDPDFRLDFQLFRMWGHFVGLN
jgi:hypothetical protein